MAGPTEVFECSRRTAHDIWRHRVHGEERVSLPGRCSAAFIIATASHAKTGCGRTTGVLPLEARIGFLRRTAGLERRLTPHGMRHACATHMLEGGADLRYLQDLLGHTSLRSTEVYTHLTIVHLKEALARCHLRERSSTPADDSAEVAR
jgi:integrase